MIPFVHAGWFLAAYLAVQAVAFSAGLPEEKPLWPDPEFKNPIHYDSETVRQNPAGKGSLSGQNRVFSFVSTPSYAIFQASPESANGVGLVICPGGGYRDVWLDREGTDFALWLKGHGVTSLVLKYRTNAGEGPGDQRKYPWDIYLPAVFADGRQALRTLRSQAAQLNLDPNKIGICGFSAGGNLAFNAVFRPEPNPDAKAVRGEPDFGGLFYPWLRDDVREMVSSAGHIPPLFIMNAADDKLTPIGSCVDFYQLLLKVNARAELHVFGKGGHGFDMGEGRGESAPLWKESFIAWLKDTKLIK